MATSNDLAVIERTLAPVQVLGTLDPVDDGDQLCAFSRGLALREMARAAVSTDARESDASAKSCLRWLAVSEKYEQTIRSNSRLRTARLIKAEKDFGKLESLEKPKSNGATNVTDVPAESE